MKSAFVKSFLVDRSVSKLTLSELVFDQFSSRDSIRRTKIIRYGSYQNKYSGIRLLDIRIQDTFGFRTCPKGLRVRNPQVPVKGIQAY